MVYGSAIKNPLTIIAIFAGIAEISGTAVLPFVSSDNQRLYIYFLIFFPSLLVSLFFWTLNCNHSVLYAPSDWKDEANFFRKFSSISEKEEKEKIEEEVREVIRLPVNDSTLIVEEGEEISREGLTEKTTETATDISATSMADQKKNISLKGFRDRYALYSFAEEFGIRKVEAATGLSFRRNVRFEPDSSPAIVFDGMAVVNDQIHVVEVKRFVNFKGFPDSIDYFMHRVKIASQDFKANNKIMMLHIVLVTGEKLDKKQIELVKNRLSKYDISYKLYNYSIEDVENTTYD